MKTDKIKAAISAAIRAGAREASDEHLGNANIHRPDERELLKGVMQAMTEYTRGLLEQANNALEKAMIICDAVPSKAHQSGVNEPLKHIGRLVNNGDDCFFYYRDIREAQKAVKEALNYDDDDREPTREEIVAYYEDLIKTIEHYAFTSASNGHHMTQITRAVAQHNSGFDRLLHKNPLGTPRGKAVADIVRSAEAIDAACFRFWVSEAARNPSNMAKLIMHCTTEQEYRDAIMPLVMGAQSVIQKAQAS